MLLHFARRIIEKDGNRKNCRQGFLSSSSYEYRQTSIWMAWPRHLTRFNKIATQGAPQMAVDKEANSLSRVYSYYSKFNLCLFYM